MFSTSIGSVEPGTYQTDKPILKNEGLDWVDYGGQGAIPMEYNGVTYVKNFHEVAPPPVTKVPFTLDVDGFELFSGELTPKA